MTSTILTAVDRPAPCGTPERLRWHLAHGQTCRQCEHIAEAPSPVACWQCGTADRPHTVAYFRWLESENARLRLALTRARTKPGDLAATVHAQRTQLDAARDGFDALLRVNVIRHEAVVRVRRLVFGSSQ